MKLMIVGDTHGNTRWLRKLIEYAAGFKIQHVLVLGDFGLWTHVIEGHEFLDFTNEYAKEAGLSVYAIGGNHENWDHWNWYVNNNPTGGKGWIYVRNRVLIAPKVHHWKWGGLNFLGVGGAVSIDKDWRLQKERGGVDPWSNKRVAGSGPRTLWWPDEQLTDDDVQKAIGYASRDIDIVVSHDCSNQTPFRDRLKPDPDSQIHRQRIDRVLKAVKPDLHFHGHMHTKYDWQNTLDYEHYIQTYGLECDEMPYSYGIFDTDDKQFIWRGVIE